VQYYELMYKSESTMQCTILYWPCNLWHPKKLVARKSTSGRAMHC
jgi:hypothetical protein